MKTALVTGGAGFVGRRITKRLLDIGVHVTIVDDLSSGKPPMDWLPVPEPPLTFLQLDVRRYFAAGASCDFDIIFHCAAVVGGRLVIDGDPLRVATDLAIDSDFFNWIVKQRTRPRKVVYFSSSAVYPIELQRNGGAVSLVEDYVNFHASRLGMPDQSYGLSKFVGEYLANKAAKQYGLNVVCYRPFSGYGEDQSYDYPFPSIVKRVFDNENSVVVWGSGKQQRDFIYIDDAVDAVFATMDLLKPGEALNLGSGQGTTFTALAKLTANILGREIKVSNDSTKPEGVFYRVADIYKLAQWYTLTTSLAAGIEKMLAELRLDKSRPPV